MENLICNKAIIPAFKKSTGKGECEGGSLKNNSSPVRLVDSGLHRH